MARPLRLEFAGALYHLTSRGNVQADIYLDDADRRIFLRFLGSTVAKFKWRLHAYCLMGNHYHLLAETPEPNLSRGMRHLNGGYTQAFNRRHRRVGHVLQGRFHAIVVERESYFVEVARYIALNPVRAGLRNSAAEWAWSSFRATAGLELAPPWLNTDALLAVFSSEPAAAMQRYDEFVASGVDRPAPWNSIRGQLLLGTEAFAERMRPLLEQHTSKVAVPRAQRFSARPPLQSLLPSGLTKRDRNARIVEACRDYGFGLSDVARHVGVSYSTVFRITQLRNDEMEDLTPAFQGG